MRLALYPLLLANAFCCHAQQATVFQKPDLDFSVALRPPWHLFPSTQRDGFYEFVNDGGDVFSVTVRTPTPERRFLLSQARDGRITKAGLEAIRANLEATTNKRRVVQDVVAVSNQRGYFQGYLWPHETIDSKRFFVVWTFSFLFRDREYKLEFTGASAENEQAATAHFRSIWKTDFDIILKGFVIKE